MQKNSDDNCPCRYWGRPLGKPYQSGAKFAVGHWDTLDSPGKRHLDIRLSCRQNWRLGAHTYGMSENLYKNPAGIRNEVPYPYRGATGAAMREVFIGEPCCRSWAIGEESGIPRSVCAMYTDKGIVGISNPCTNGHEKNHK